MDQKQNSLPAHNSSSETSSTHLTNEPTITFTQSEFSEFIEAMFVEGRKRVEEYIKTEEWRSFYE